MTRTPIRRQHVTSADGTKIAVTITGDGPPLVVCPGSLATARDWQMVARALAPRMTTYALDRRGHGDSGDSPAYRLDLEQEDLAAVAELAGPGVTLLGHSYGAVIALGLAERLARASGTSAQLVLYEPPLRLDGPVGGAVVEEYARAVGDDDLDGALALGLRQFVGMPDEAIALMRGQPIWARLSGMTPSWTREIRALDEFLAGLGRDLGRYGAVSVPVLLLMGELSPPWLTTASRHLARSLPDVTVAGLPGQAHDAHVFAAGTVAEQIARFAL
jgi:pimeloyl-ACP methyl ester carboxylesterase